ncbi:hypothetical protein M378DRAFT_154857 [Amanita muscaria Koide BX008]|uniref:Uncharacterized protein n=1 Tax=Amanita muscaria (strain Koide BX008) TaxID=946122 RepID=A0A0C2XA87_AMAMK|nr:hypothetical protein M378DRAFT_154857 [Amanita muscaria Koide BX008]
MPSRRSRSRSRSQSPSRPRDRSRSASPRRRTEEQLPYDAQPISESDYFLKMDEFRSWLREEKRKYFDELSGEKARSYFRKFVKSWNRGKLSKKFYQGIEPSSTNNTAYKWSFTDKASRADGDALRNAREEVNAATYTTKRSDRGEPSAAAAASSSGRLSGPTLPTPADLVHARELEAEYREEERKHKRKRDKMEAKERIEDMVGPKEVGKEGMLEKKRAKREQDRTFREKGDEGLEVDETTLMGGGDGFKDALVRRDAAKRRFEFKAEEKEVARRERATAIREKEKATMDMFQQLAKQRFG